MAKTEPLHTRVVAQFGVSEEEAVGLIMAGRIYLGHVPVDKPGMAVATDTVLTLKEKPRRYASRSGYKLQKALTVFGVNPTGLTVCDIGASNGGFTDCLLQHGAMRVFAVDVAYGILAWELRNDPRVTVLERTNARRLTPQQLGTVCDLVTADVSFISLDRIFPAIDTILTDGGACITLIKPQFEAPRQALGKNGCIKDPTVLPGVLTHLFESAAQHRLYLQALTVSPIHGTNGNVEYLALFLRTPETGAADWPALLQEALASRPDEDAKAPADGEI